ncbi:tripartite tricarboxylate transporter substrate binding protein [Sinorhizobium prairiense]|uniref:tripartite tricarboxylate transporter substrate binding protein n=1 Tax=unclassified Sinorhizobium TaxID=2613772 RepID=UPI0023D8133E|nr:MULTISPECIES: tripartite tricarboxylate transporter substrate binding protein [unclassified Sinorhizobium]WEJ11527.1 tripartite tricarboxylate transporter substrate binding protein [Sinorhizobium sp. M103]WEJ16758.1 tripartite tricarboxylate transporter substrate binding protein [Sinorhizobium sp. K101]WEJ38519.1 tripartite tricarboxylate transporter substrate binding protein [Sinorhizobium sp. C101]
MKQLIRNTTLTATLLLGTSMAHAEWPADRPIEFIVAFAPGGGTDVMNRTLAPYLEEELGAKITVLNRPGASGEIAYTALTEARPDGYTVSSLNTPGYLTMQMDRKVRFDPAKLCLVARIVEDPGSFIVQANSEFNSLKDLVAYAKANPGAVTVGTTGLGTDEHLAMLQLEKSAGIDLTAVTFNGANEARTALLGGHVMTIGINVGEFVSSDSSAFKNLGQFAEERSVIAPDLQTAKEQGFEVLMSSERGIAMGCEVPEEIRMKFSDAVKKALDNPEFQAKAKQQSLALSYLSAEQWNKELPVRGERLGAIWKLAKEQK